MTSVRACLEIIRYYEFTNSEYPEIKLKYIENMYVQFCSGQNL